MNCERFDAEKVFNRRGQRDKSAKQGKTASSGRHRASDRKAFIITRVFFGLPRTVSVGFPATFIFLQFLFGGHAWAEDYDIIPSLMVKEEYNDNIFFSSTSRTSSFITALVPRLVLAKRDERTDAALTVGLDGFIYSDSRGVVTALNQHYGGRASYMLTPRLRGSVDASYTINNQPDQNLELNGSVINAVRRDLQIYSGGLDYNLTEKSTVGLAYQYDQEDYAGVPTSDNSSHSASLGYEYDLRAFLPSARGRFNFGFNEYEFTDSRTDNYTATVGMGWAFSETWDFTADVGGRYTSAEYDEMTFVSIQEPPYVGISTVRLSNTGCGWVARAALSARGQTQNGSLIFNHNVALSSSRSGASETTSVDLNYRRYFTDKLSSWMTVGYQLSDSGGQQFSSTSINEDYVRVNAGLQYEFDRNMALDASYSYTRAIYNQTDTSAYRNSFVVSFSVRYPLLDRW
jgi:opacity protein-like surface antigen